MTVGYGFNGTSYSGHYANIISIGPNRSGTTFGMVNMAGNLPGFLMPLVITAFTKGHEGSSVHWGYAFWIFGGLYGVGTVIFVTLARGDVQPFNYKEYNSESDLEKKVPRLPTFRSVGEDS
jgi:nitrate/nitrite transporter NarK